MDSAEEDASLVRVVRRRLGNNSKCGEFVLLLELLLLD